MLTSLQQVAVRSKQLQPGQNSCSGYVASFLAVVIEIASLLLVLWQFYCNYNTGFTKECRQETKKETKTLDNVNIEIKC
jgi:hypothetical protein